jgi:AAA domain
VEDVSLRFQIAALRKALGDSPADRYIMNVSGRGYCLVGTSAQPSSQRPPAQKTTRCPLPVAPMRIVGREVDVQDICAKTISDRFVTVVGPGGIGKTTVAVFAAHRLISEFNDEVVFVDLGPVGAASLVPGIVGSALGLVANAQDPDQALLDFLRDRSLLLVIDNCEHLINAVAILAERIVKEAPSIHILATSRDLTRRGTPCGCPGETE